MKLRLDSKIQWSIAFRRLLSVGKDRDLNNAAMEATDDSHNNYDVAKETAASLGMLEKRIPARLNTIKLALVDIDRRQAYEPWRLALAVDFVESIERNCEQLLETMRKNRLSAAAWIARNLLELLVWVKFCGVSRENAWRFHEDALRDLKALSELYDRQCNAIGVENKARSQREQLLKDVASERFGLEDIDDKFLHVGNASKTEGVDLGAQFHSSDPALSKFAHPTALLVHGLAHQRELCRNLQAVYTTHGVYYAAQCTLALEAQLGIQ